VRKKILGKNTKPRRADFVVDSSQEFDHIRAQDRDTQRASLTRCGMTNRPARITQAEIERAIRAAKKAGLPEIEIKIGNDAAIRIPISPNNPVADSGDLIL
jgi:hypothetical protein